MTYWVTDQTETREHYRIRAYSRCSVTTSAFIALRVHRDVPRAPRLLLDLDLPVFHRRVPSRSLFVTPEPQIDVCIAHRETAQRDVRQPPGQLRIDQQPVRGSVSPKAQDRLQ